MAFWPWFWPAGGEGRPPWRRAPTITEYPIPPTPGSPAGIAAGSDGALWFTEYEGDKIGRITTGGAISEYPIPTAPSAPYGIAAGPDGALWFTEQVAGRIGRITTSGAISEYPIPTAASMPVGIAAGPDGALWFTETLGNKIGRITTPTPTLAPCQPLDLVATSSAIPLTPVVPSQLDGLAINEWWPVPNVFCDITQTVNYQGGAVKLSTCPDGSCTIVADDHLTLTVTPPGGIAVAKEFDFLAVDQPPADVTSMFQPGVNTVRAQLSDRVGPYYGSPRPFYLVSPSSQLSCPPKAWVVPPGDGDCDGFTTTAEYFAGTNPNLACGVNAWPVDNNDDRKAGLPDILAYIPVFNTTGPGLPYKARYDLNTGNKIGLPDVLMFIPFFNQTCTP